MTAQTEDLTSTLAELTATDTTAAIEAPVFAELAKRIADVRERLAITDGELAAIAEVLGGAHPSKH